MAFDHLTVCRLILPMSLLSGVSAVNVPDALKWLQYVAYTRFVYRRAFSTNVGSYGLLIMFHNEFEDLTFYCTAKACMGKSFKGTQVCF
jgi:hypothetical protein